jgi:hypothetical protein
MMIRKGNFVYAPWAQHGDDKALTGEVVSVSKGKARVIWHDNGDVTEKGSESIFDVAYISQFIIEEK